LTAVASLLLTEELPALDDEKDRVRDGAMAVFLGAATPAEVDERRLG
jgi:hypothetical protein